jgi:hypothetical protein
VALTYRRVFLVEMFLLLRPSALSSVSDGLWLCGWDLDMRRTCGGLWLHFPKVVWWWKLSKSI